MAEITATHHHDDIASSSTASGSASTPPYVHFDIFVNHFEDETRVFAMELCKRLVSHGYHVFLDGIDKEVTPRVEAAISVAALQIAIFSPIYATCKWCLDTLVQMTNSEAAILPVFYGVEPFHLRYTGKDDKGPYAQSLRAHEGRYDSKIIEAWRDALCDVSNISGFQLEESNGGQEVLLGKVVDSIFKTCPLPYHVFLSHRGPDTKEKLAQPLYKRLHGLRELRVFLDKPELVGALKIETQIELAIQFASVNIVIFSPRFPESSWCMDELFLITKATGTILPVFYEVEPSDLDGFYIETLYCHHREKQRQDTRTIEKWRDALANVPKSDEFILAGEELKEELMDKIVERVRKYIPKPLEFMISSEEQRAWKSALKDVPKRKSALKDVPKRSQAVPVKDIYAGLHEKLEDFEKAVLSQQEEEPIEAKVVGILGGVGTGKTALAKEIFKWKRSNYSESSCLFNVRNYVARKYALKDLQSMIIKELKHSPSKEIESVGEGKEILKQHLQSCQALVILDDVDHVDQLDALIPILHPKSLILVTSRNKDVLNKFGIVNSSIYHLTGLNGEDSRNLLLSYALDRPFPRQPSDDQHIESLVPEFVTACDGLPEPLKELGESLRGKDRSGWEEQLNQLGHKFRHNCKLFIQKKLDICYESLNEEEQQIFLDVACFFIGEDRDSATRIFGMEGLEKLEKLENRCLLKLTSKIEMNEFLRNYGRNKANRLTPRWLWHQEADRLTPRRLWHQETKQINDFLEKSPSVSASQETKQINDLLEKSPSELAQFRGITMNGDHGVETEMPCCKQSGETFSGSRNLKFLAAQGGYVEKILTRVGSADLLWLKWNKCTHSSLPPWISMEKLRVLELDGSKLTELWQTESQVPLQLRELNICAPLSRFPQSIGQLEFLEKIVLKCSGPLPFIALPEEFCRLRSLKYLEMRECSGMRSLPDSFGDLANLQYLDLKGASCLQMLPKSFGNLTLLKYLFLERCSEIRVLPGLEHFTSLEKLDVRGCKNLESIPELGRLIKLQILDVSGCSHIKWLSGLKHLNSLETFIVSGCEKLRSIPGLGQLTKLLELNVSGCTEIILLPGLENLTSLESFNVSGCQKLQSIGGLGQLAKLQTLDVSGCSEIQTLPGLKHLTSLEAFNVSGCKKLQSIDVSGSRGIHTLSGLEHLTSLRKLNVSGCKKLQRLPRLGLLTKLRTIDVSGCCEIQSLFGLEHLTSLKTLNVSGCEKLQSIRGLGQLRKLQVLNFSRCYEIRELRGVDCMMSLETLNISEFKKLQQIRWLGRLRKLQTLDVGGCQIKRLLGLKYLTSLKKLNVSECKNLQGIPELGKLTNLQILNVSGCNDIRELPGVERLTSLETLNVSECPNLEGIPELRQLTKLQTLDASGCCQIKSLLGLENLTSLKTLNIMRCDKLHSVPGLAQLKKLQILHVGCPRLQRMPSLEHLTSLQTLDITKCCILQAEDVTECQRLESIPTLGSLTKLRKLNLSRLYSLQELPSLEHLTSLETLTLSRLYRLRELPSLEHLTSLETLTLSSLKLIESIPGLGQLKKLQALGISDCRMQTLPSLEHLTSLQSLHVGGCPKIQTLQGVDHLISLQSLDVSDCKELESIPPLRFLQKLKSLHVKRCLRIRDLPGVEHLISLETLDVRYCEELESIPPLRFLVKLKSLNVAVCPKIQDLPGVEHLISLESLAVWYCEELESIPPLRFLQKLKSLDVGRCPKIQDLPGVEHLLSLESLKVENCRELESIPPLRFLQKLKTLHVERCFKIRDLPGVEHAMLLKSLHVSGCPVRWRRGVREQLRQRGTRLYEDKNMHLYMHLEDSD